MKRTLKKLLASVAAAASASVAFPVLFATPASAAIHEGSITLTPSSGNSATVFDIALPGISQCQEDSAGGGWRVTSYMVPVTVDPSSIQFGPQGPDPWTYGANGGTYETFQMPLWTDLGDNYVSVSTVNSPVPGGPGTIQQPGEFDFDVYAPGDVPAGAYNIGIACTDETTTIQQYWNTTITVVEDSVNGGPAGFTWSVGAAAPAPELTALTPGDGTLTATFAHAGSTPAATFTATATPDAADTDCATATEVTTPAISEVAPITISSLVNACDYSVVVTASNGVGTPAASNAMTATPTPGARPAVQNLQATQGAPGSGTATVTWSAPAGPDTPNGYDVQITPAGPTVTVSGTSASISGMEENVEYTVTVTPVHPAPYVGTPASVSFTALPAAVLYQELDVTVPDGVLVLTQVCGTHGEIPADERGTTGFPVGSLPARPADLDGTAPLLEDGTQDPEFASYPNPTPASATYCGVDFQTAELIMEGDGAGQFYAADAVLNQVTVLDTRDNDPGWTVTGTMGDFQAGTPGTDPSFSGDQLGWEPLADDTDPIPGSDYDQAVTAGPIVDPNTPGGLGDGATLASAEPGAGRGIAKLDARLKLLIPVSVFSGNYTGTLTITAS